MPDAGSQRDILAEVMAQGRKVLVPHLAEMLKREKIETIGGAEERRRFWQRAMTPEQEQMLWQTEMANRGITELTPDVALEIGLGISQKVYPSRWDMATAEGREHESEIAQWAWQHAKKGDPNAAADEQPTPAQPAPTNEGEG
jgi:hypothetical protein